MTAKIRADLLLVQRGVFESRARAQAAIAAGLVRVDGALLAKASTEIPVAAAIVAEPAHPYVSRGGVKLAAALDAFSIDPAGKRCLDVGASTGGFTDVLLRRGAAHVDCVDTGREQLHKSLRDDPRVTPREGTDIRAFVSESAGQYDLAVIDVSFISLKLVLPPVALLLKHGGDLVALIKPQFEVGRGRVGKGGVVKDDAVRSEAVARVRALAGELGLIAVHPIPSPIAGGDGNVEFLIAAKRP